MRKKYVLLIGILILMVFGGIPKKVNAETEEVYSLEGNITYDKDNWRDFNGTKEEWEILFNISIPIKLHSYDMLYWHSQYSGECDVLSIIFHWRPPPINGTSGTSFYPHPDYSDICDDRHCHNLYNIGTHDDDNPYILVKRRGFLNPKGYLYHLTWKFWIERDIVENQPNDIIGINLMPFLLGFMCIGVIIVYTEKIKN